MKKIIIIGLALLLTSCSAFKGGQSDEKKTEVKNITFSTKDLPANYFAYVDIAKVANMPPLDEKLTGYLFEQIAGKETQIRATIEKSNTMTSKVKDNLCRDLSGPLCDFNIDIYNGSNFGLKLFEQTSKKPISETTIVSAPLTSWSIDWIHSSVKLGESAATICKDGENSCLNKNTTNPLAKLYAICTLKAKNDMDNCLKHVLSEEESRNFAFNIGYVTGYNISYDVGNQN